MVAPFAAHAQDLSPSYALTSPTWQHDPELSPQTSLMSVGSVRLATAGSTTGAGLSLEAGRQWFARLGMGRSMASEVMSLGGGYRFADGDALSMHVTRQLGQDRLGLAVRYDWSRSYLRLSYEAPMRPLNGTDTLRFSAGIRF
jgi:hypothetical protein